jgi:hypothetical protein
MVRNYLVILLTVLTISVFTLVIIQLTGISRNSWTRLLQGHKEGEEFNGNFYTKEGELYHGEIFHEETKTRDQIVRGMPKTTIQFYETKYNFGSVGEGKILSHTFRFKNTGSNPLMIAKTDVTCGCTVPAYHSEAIAAGADGEITIEFNTAGKSGIQEKNIVVHSNTTPETVTIGIEADVR